MARTVVALAAPPEQVFGLLGDPRSLAYFVVGTRVIRRFDPHWPDPGSKVHHAVGIGPLALRDETEVVSSEPDHRLVLDVRLRPLGLFRVEFGLTPHPDGTQLTVDEFAVGGLVALPALSQLVDRLIALRNVEMSRRLQRLVERRQRQRSLAQSEA